METALSNQSDRITKVIVKKVADLEGVDPLDLEIPLYEVVDPDALQSLLVDEITGEHREHIRVKFQYYGYDIIVNGEGEVAILNS